MTPKNHNLVTLLRDINYRGVEDLLWRICSHITVFGQQGYPLQILRFFDHLLAQQGRIVSSVL